MDKDCVKIGNNLDWVLGGMVIIADDIETGVKIFTAWVPDYEYGGVSVATPKVSKDLVTL